MSRSGYSEDCENVSLWRNAVDRAIWGKRGQKLLRDLLTALDAMPVKRLIADDLVRPDGECCALGAVAIARRMDVAGIEPADRHQVAAHFDIAPALAAEYPNALSKEELGARTGYEPNGGGFNNALSRLRTLELEHGRGEIKASDDLFG